MKYFTRDLIERYGCLDDEAVFRDAETEWEARLARYEAGLQSIEPELPEHIRAFTRLLLHDAIVWSIARQGDKLIMVLRKDVPPKDVVILTYTLIEEPVIDRDALSPDYRGEVMDYKYDEFELIRDCGQRTYAQSILFGNGWEMSLRFSDVQVSLAQPVYPLPGTVFVPASAPAVAPSA
jgi:hypothetical protein